jgi:hypothetical protein
MIVVFWRSPRLSGAKDFRVYKSRDPDRGDVVLVEIHLFRNFALTLAWKLFGVIALDFVLLRIWGPDLVNRHDNLALAGALGCLLVAIVATAWLAFQLWMDVQRFLDAKRHMARADRLKREL